MLHLLTDSYAISRINIGQQKRRRCNKAIYELH